MFINRDSELELLEREYRTKGPSFTVIYGRRRVGKTELISQFIKDKPAIFFYATEANINHQLQLMAEQIIAFTGKEYLENIAFQNFDQLFSFLADNIGNKKIILAIDEYQHLVNSDNSFSSMLQKIWDTTLKSKNIHLILCGSVITMMYSEVLNYNSPLYGRRTSNIHLKQMKFKHIGEFIKNVSKIDRMNIFASFGTIPRYLELYDGSKSFIQNIKEQILNKDSYLYQEVKFLLKNEISEPVTYFTILEIIAKGDSKIGNIASKVGVPTSHLSRYMQRLVDLDMIEKEVPVTEKNPEKSKLGRYRIKDNFVNFWFYYVFMNQSYLEIGNTDYVIKKMNESFNERFVSFCFEDYAKECILEDPEKYIGFLPVKVGRWWNNKEEIDLVAIGENDIAFIECKWQNQKIGFDTYRELFRKSELVENDKGLNKVMVFFLKNGFKKGVDATGGKFFIYNK